MRLTFCAACGAADDLQHHHLVTRPEGGSDDERNLITLCSPCHFKLHERRRNGVYNVSQRTKDALAAKKAQGVKLGGSNHRSLQNGAEAKARAEALRPVFTELAGKAANAIAAELNRRGVETPTGSPWSAVTVLRVQRRLAEAAS